MGQPALGGARHPGVIVEVFLVLEGNSLRVVECAAIYRQANGFCKASLHGDLVLPHH